MRKVSQTARAKITPPVLAKRWGIGVDRVLAWIRSGQLHAINGAVSPAGRPRFLIGEDDIAAFEAARAVTPPPKRAPNRKRRDPEVVEFFH